jgi:HEAT repeat protein
VPEVRADAAAALGDVLEHGGREAASALKAVAKDPDAATRKRAAAALGRAKGGMAGAAAKALAAFCGDAEPSVRAEAAASLGALGAAGHEAGALPSLVADKDASVRAAARKAAQAIGGGGTELDKALLSTLVGAPLADRGEIAETAGMVGASATVRAALADSDASVRRAAAEHARGDANLAALSAALGDVDAAVRVAAVRGLVGAKAAGALAQAAHSPDADVRVAALEALGEVSGGTDAAARAALEGALSDGSERVRGAAVRGLGALGASAAQRLETALADPARDVRDAAVLALGAAWAERSADDLAGALRDETNADRRWAAAIALARQGQNAPAAVKALDSVALAGTPVARLTARVGRAFVARAAELAAFMHLLRNGS